MKPTLPQFKLPKLTAAHLPTSWQDILWQERSYSRNEDSDFTQRLEKSLVDEAKSASTLRERPSLIEVEIALRHGCTVQADMRDVWARRLERLDREMNKPVPLDTQIANLQHPHWLERFLARYMLLHRGGEIVYQLQPLTQQAAPPLRQFALRILQSIGVDTELRLATAINRLLCPHCLVRCHQNWVDMPWQPDFYFYGCRRCDQSREFLDCPFEIVAVLDDRRTEEHRLHQNSIHVHLPARRELFDFDRVAIIHATDEQVERFAVQVGNDTDELRRDRYPQMECTIHPDCHLSANSLKILRRTFGRVSSAANGVS